MLFGAVGLSSGNSVGITRGAWIFLIGAILMALSIWWGRRNRTGAAAMEASRMPTAQGTLVGAFANHRQSLTGRQIAGALFGVIGLGAIGATFLSAHKELIAGDPTKDAAVQFVQKGLRSPEIGRASGRE